MSSQQGAAEVQEKRGTLRFIDAHCHLDAFDDLPEVLERARESGVIHLVANGLWRGPGDFGRALELARLYPDLISATVAIHPHDAAKAPREDFDRVARLACDPGICAVGETGLDYHYNLSLPGIQREVLRWHIRLARAIGKPLILHVREAHGDALQIFREEGAEGIPTQVHCFTGTPSEAQEWIDLGCHLSFSGALTFKNGAEIREAACLVPLDRLLIETDSPYLAPIPYRGKRCEPAFAIETLRVLAHLRALSAEALARITTENAMRFFSIETTS